MVRDAVATLVELTPHCHNVLPMLLEVYRVMSFSRMFVSKIIALPDLLAMSAYRSTTGSAVTSIKCSDPRLFLPWCTTTLQLRIDVASRVMKKFSIIVGFRDSPAGLCTFMLVVRLRIIFCICVAARASICTVVGICPIVSCGVAFVDFVFRGADLGA